MEVKLFELRSIVRNGLVNYHALKDMACNCTPPQLLARAFGINMRYDRRIDCRPTWGAYSIQVILPDIPK